MSTDREKSQKGSARDHGPQGTHVFSRGEVDRLIEDVSSGDNEARGAHLKGISEGVRDQVFALRGARVVLGRAPSCDIVISDASVSSEHARLSKESDGWRVANLLSTNGTFVNNNNKISNSALNDGDRLRLGRVEFVMHAPEFSSESRDSDGALLRWLPWVGAAVVVVVIAWIALS
jgi:hypothetical protein